MLKDDKNPYRKIGYNIYSVKLYYFSALENNDSAQ